MATIQKKTIPIVQKVTCPHCWNEFPPEDSLWIARHPELQGEDPRLSETEYLRFSPERFDIKCGAIDPRGYPSTDVACPKCHLAIARPLIEIPPFFLSIFGAPSSGKSYFLAAMTWRLRQIFPQHFMMAFSDADAAANVELQRNENLQFLNMERDKPVALDKTQLEADHLYDEVLIGGERVRYIRPFLFSLRPLPTHPNSNSRSISRVVCLYDNAGEHFLPNSDQATVPVTRHLGLSEALLFLFDPTQDMRFRQAVQGKTDDPQMKMRENRSKRESEVRQDTILMEAANKVKQQVGLSQNELHDKPLVVIITKYDTWSSLLGEERIEDPLLSDPRGGPDGVIFDKVEAISDRVRKVLVEHASELISVAEGFCREVIYMPVSATGCSPRVDDEGEAIGIAPKDINPMWVEIPLLYTLARWTEGVIPHRKRKDKEDPPAATSNSRPPQLS